MADSRPCVPPPPKPPSPVPIPCESTSNPPPPPCAAVPCLRATRSRKLPMGTSMDHGQLCLLPCLWGRAPHPRLPVNPPPGPRGAARARCPKRPAIGKGVGGLQRGSYGTVGERRVRPEAVETSPEAKGGSITREGTPEAAPEPVRQAVGGGCQSGWGRLLSVTNAIEAGTWRQGDSGWA